MATNILIPATAESVSEVVLLEWLKKDGEWVNADEAVCVLETDKADVELPSPASGVLHISRQAGETVAVGDSIASIDESGDKKEVSKPAQAKTEPIDTDKDTSKEVRPQPEQFIAKEEQSPSVRRMVTEHSLDPKDIQGTGRSGRILKEDVQAHLEQKKEAPQTPPREEQPSRREEPAEREAAPRKTRDEGDRGDRMRYAYDSSPRAEEGVKRVPMSKIRKRIADNLVHSQQTAAMLTTFNEVDMSAVLNLREKYRDRFDEIHGVKLGVMSFFVRACAMALGEFPSLNASVEGNDIVYHASVDMGIAVSTERGLVVPVLRGADRMSYANIELEIKRLAAAARNGRLGIQELTGGTFTITNGGVFGSLLSTPILNLPQSGILGMHTIKKRPVVVEDKVEIRPMMYVALTYDHRIVDGNISVSFLVRVKECLEDPCRLMLGI